MIYLSAGLTVHEHAQDGTELHGGGVVVPPAGAVIPPFRLAGNFHGTGVSVGAAGHDGEKAENSFALSQAFQTRARMLKECGKDLHAVLRHVALPQQRRVGMGHRGGADDAEVGPDGVGVALGFFPAGNFFKQPCEHPIERGAGGRDEHGGNGRGGVGGVIADAIGEALPPIGGGGGIFPPGGQIDLPCPDEPGQNQGELGLAVGGDFQIQIIFAGFGLEGVEERALFAFLVWEIGLISHICEYF